MTLKVRSPAWAARKGGIGSRSLSSADCDEDGDDDLNSKDANKDIQKLQATKSPSPQQLSAFDMQWSQQQEHEEVGMDSIDASEDRVMQLAVQKQKTSSRRLSSDTSVTYASSSGSSSLVSDRRSDKEDLNEIGADNKIEIDEILARNMTISFNQETGKNVKSASSCLGIPFLDYLEKQVSKLNKENEKASTCYAAKVSPRCNNNMHPELSPIASQSAAAAEEKTVQLLRREVLGLHLTLDTLKKDSREWMLLKSILDDAREELNAVLEDQQLVRSIKTANT